MRGEMRDYFILYMIKIDILSAQNKDDICSLFQVEELMYYSLTVQCTGLRVGFNPLLQKIEELAVCTSLTEPPIEKLHVCIPLTVQSEELAVPLSLYIL